MSNQTELPEKITMGSRVNEIVQCAKCGKELKIEQRTAFAGDDGEDIYFCEDCLSEINKELENQTQNPNMLGAIFLGLAAAITGGLGWFLLTILINKSFGYAAIALGWLIGYAVCLGSGNKKGFKLQVIAAILTTLSLIISEFMIYLHFVGQAPEINVSAPILLTYLALSGKFLFAIENFAKDMISPIGLLIWGIGIWFAYCVPKAEKL